MKHVKKLFVALATGVIALTACAQKSNSYESPMSEADATLKEGYPDFNWKTGLRLPAKPERIKEWLSH